MSAHPARSENDPVSQQQAAQAGRYITEAERTVLLSLGGKMTAEIKKQRAMTGERPRMIGDAIRSDLVDAIHHFVSKRSMKFSSFRDIWRQRKLSVLHYATPKKCTEGMYLQEAFSIALGLLMKEEPPAATAPAAASEKGRAADASEESARHTTAAQDFGQMLLPFQIGALYSLYCLHGTQVFQPPLPIRISAQAILALVSLRHRLKAAGPLASDALAVLARMILGNSRDGNNDGGVGVLQPAAYIGPASIMYVDTLVEPAKAIKGKKEIQADDGRRKELDRTMAARAKAAGARALRAGSGAGGVGQWEANRWLAEGTLELVESVCARVDGLRSAYDKYAEALEVAKLPDYVSERRVRGSDENHAAHRSEQFSRDVRGMLGLAGDDSSSPQRLYGLDLLEECPPVASMVSLPQGDHTAPSSAPALPPLPRLPEVPRARVIKVPDVTRGSDGSTVGGRKRRRREGAGDSGNSRPDQSGRDNSRDTASGSGVGGSDGGPRSGSAADGIGARDETGDTVEDVRIRPRRTGHRAVRDHVRLLEESLQAAELQDNAGGDEPGRGVKGRPSGGASASDRISRLPGDLGGSAPQDRGRPPGGLGNAASGAGAKLPGGLGKIVSEGQQRLPGGLGKVVSRSSDDSSAALGRRRKHASTAVGAGATFDGPSDAELGRRQKRMTRTRGCGDGGSVGGGRDDQSRTESKRKRLAPEDEIQADESGLEDVSHNGENAAALQEMEAFVAEVTGGSSIDRAGDVAAKRQRRPSRDRDDRSEIDGASDAPEPAAAPSRKRARAAANTTRPVSGTSTSADKERGSDAKQKPTAASRGRPPQAREDGATNAAPSSRRERRGENATMCGEADSITEAAPSDSLDDFEGSPASIAASQAAASSAPRASGRPRKNCSDSSKKVTAAASRGRGRPSKDAMHEESEGLSGSSTEAAVGGGRRAARGTAEANTLRGEPRVSRSPASTRASAPGDPARSSADSASPSVITDEREKLGPYGGGGLSNEEQLGEDEEEEEDEVVSLMRFVSEVQSSLTAAPAKETAVQASNASLTRRAPPGRRGRRASRSDAGGKPSGSARGRKKPKPFFSSGDAVGKAAVSRTALSDEPSGASASPARATQPTGDELGDGRGVREAGAKMTTTTTQAPTASRVTVSPTKAAARAAPAAGIAGESPMAGETSSDSDSNSEHGGGERDRRISIARSSGGDSAAQAAATVNEKPTPGDVRVGIDDGAVGQHHDGVAEEQTRQDRRVTEGTRRTTPDIDEGNGRGGRSEGCKNGLRSRDEAACGSLTSPSFPAANDLADGGRPGEQEARIPADGQAESSSGAMAMQSATISGAGEEANAAAAARVGVASVAGAAAEAIQEMGETSSDSDDDDQ